MLLTALATLLLAAAPPKAPPPEKLDALDFNNGTVLVKESGSYGAGVDSWAAWRLADGSPTGWCSATNAPTGASFEYELDGPWTLETFVVDASTVEEDSYPGVSVKTVALAIATGSGAWKSLGQFVVPQHTRKAFPLPAGTSATRVKVDVLGNHGHAEYTEIAELDLLGTRRAPAPLRSFTGVFNTSYGPMRVEQDGDQLFGCYDYGTIVGSVWGTVTGRVAQLTWYEEGEASTREGSATFAAVKDEAGQPGFWGVWFENGQLANLWTGATTEEPPACTVHKKGQLERQLRQKGHVALYGIRFDVNSDVPRPESEGTLQELSALLTGAPTLKVAIEGHTDATNSDAYNLDLSNRRAASVVKWLTEHGVKAGQLTAKGYGKTKPVADNATVQGRALNRRVEVSLAK